MTNVAVPGMDCYEDMFKEITKKLYSESVMEAGETMRIMQEYDGDTFKLEEGHNSLSAFGLAALVQNGFPTTNLFSLSAQQELEKLRAEEDTWISSDESIPWTDSKIASYNSAQKLFRCNECECVGFLSRVAEHWLGTHANLRVFQCPQCPYASAWARCVRMHLARQHNVCPDPNQESLTLWKENPVLEEVTKYLERLKNLVEGECMDQMKDDSEEESHQNATSTQTSTPPPLSPEEHHSSSPVDNSEQEILLKQEMQEQELHQHELHQQELHQQELHQQELQQQELDDELQQQELHEQELRQQELEQELQQQEIHQQELQQEFDQQELQQQEMQVQEGQITHVIEEHIQVPEEVANQLQQIAAAQHADGHPQLQIVITQQENQDLPPTIQIQIAPPQELSPHLVSSSQQTIPLQQALSQTLASTLSQQVISQAQTVVTHQPITQQIVVQQPQVVQTTITRRVASPKPAASPVPRSRQSQSENSTSSSPKRYNCTYCHYATDRRDLYTRHENIHRDEKPFHCYICQKQFNRADHVKKHFLRMHRDTPYDINRIRRTISKESLSSTSTIQYFPKPQPRPAPVQQVETVAVQSISVPGFAPPKAEDKKAPRRKPGEKRYTCCYCSWSGVDNWCLKRHLNTHLKPYVCSLCEYKAARSERLATHVFKVHNKRACSRCSFLADDQVQLNLHQQQNHHSNYDRPHILGNQTLYKDDNRQINFTHEKQLQPDNNRNYPTVNYYQSVVRSPSDLRPLVEGHKQLFCCSCILCGSQTNTQEKMLRHMELHSESECLLSSDDDNELAIIPLQTIINEDVDEASQPSNYIKKVLWKKYRPTLLSRKRFYCNLCRNVKVVISPHHNKTSLARHYFFYHSKNSHKCSLCNQKFRHRYQIYLHERNIHRTNVNFINFVIH